MTSKHLFFRVMKEDLRHKIWMIALSTLGHFLLLPVALLIWRSNEISRYGGIDGLLTQQEWVIQQKSAWIFSFFSVYLPLAGGILAILGAMIVGLFGFRYVFHKNMVDTYHSLPVRRNTLYGACYVNGILIWLIPLLVCLLPTLILGCTLLGQLGTTQMLGDMLMEIGVNLLVLLIVYLVVYHLVLTAVMLSGNMLNTLVCIAFLGFGAVSLYGLGVAYFDAYMDTFRATILDWNKAFHASPLLSAPYLLSLRVREARWDGASGLGKSILINAGMAAVLGTMAWLLYRTRDSETAGQGSGNRWVAACFRSVIGVEAGLCGWGLFVLLVSDSQAVGWGIFGGVLMAILVFGVLDIVFQMDFKAFFAHKVQMAVTVILGLLVCFAFCWDWFGYDTWLPDQEEIAEIAIYDEKLTNQRYSGAEQKVLEQMHIRDTETAYAYLERVVAREKENRNLSYGEYDGVMTRVTLKNGRSYYRYYVVTEEDQEVFWPIVTSRAYLEQTWLLDEASAADCVLIDINGRGGWNSFSEDKTLREMTLSIIRAYNQDLEEHAGKILQGNGNVVAAIELEFRYGEGKTRIRESNRLYVYTFMEHTMEVLDQMTSDGWLPAEEEAEKIRSIELALGNYTDESMDSQKRIALAREIYGVPEQAVPDENETKETGESGGIGEGTEHEIQEQVQVDFGVETFSAEMCVLNITDPAEIEELEELLSFVWDYSSGSVFQKGYISVEVTMESGTKWTGCLKKGTLPEKYILRFGEL